jgi:hypothetical protein
MCVAVGEYSPNDSSYLPFSETWNGASWSLGTVPLPGTGLNGALWAVSCPSAGDCIATGGYDTQAGVYLTLAERWNGTAWVRQQTPPITLLELSPGRPR